MWTCGVCHGISDLLVSDITTLSWTKYFQHHCPLNKHILSSASCSARAPHELGLRLGVAIGLGLKGGAMPRGYRVSGRVRARVGLVGYIELVEPLGLGVRLGVGARFAAITTMGTFHDSLDSL